MANSINFIQTNAADELISKVLTGKTLNFTRMAVGDGFNYDINVAKGFTTLVNEVLSLDITKKETLSPKSVKITSAFKNTDAQKEFYYREVGLFAEDPDTGEEVLYAYGNRNDAAELISPTSSNVVTKQLVFIISVGDSANVTFNVNADVYALQEDMLDVQANKADKNLANTGMITNCLLEVPQRVKYEFTNSILTIKAGSIVTVPNCFESDGITPKFTDVVIKNDMVIACAGTGECAVFYHHDANYFYCNQTVDHCFSGTTFPETGMLYNPSTNKITYCHNFVETSFNYSLPLMVVNLVNNVPTSVKQIFNGMGYIGSHVWIDKGVKGLIPNGRNPDGSLNNIEVVTNKLLFATTEQQGLENLKVAFNSTILRINDYYLEESNNIIRTTTDDIVRNLCIAGKIGVTSGIITSLKPYATFEAVNKSCDKPWLSSLSMPSEKYIELELGEKGATYIAPANGWFAIRKVAAVINDIFTLTVWDSTSTIEFHRTSIISPLAGAEIAFSVPISKGQTVAVDYKEAGEIKYFRFIYAQGEAN